jgi:hypothetical protein
MPVDEYDSFIEAWIDIAGDEHACLTRCRRQGRESVIVPCLAYGNGLNDAAITTSVSIIAKLLGSVGHF